MDHGRVDKVKPQHDMIYLLEWIMDFSTATHDMRFTLAERSNIDWIDRYAWKHKKRKQKQT